MINPETRASLILRLGDPADDSAWAEFVQIYEPLLMRLASRWGLQEADAREVVQETLIAVATAVSNYTAREHSGAFRGWLAAITRNKLVDYVSARSRQNLVTGDSNFDRWLSQQASEPSGLSLWDWEQKRQVFSWAAAKVREQVNEKTWQAFHRTSVLGEPVGEVAADLKIRDGMVYVARSRVMARLRKVIDAWSRADEPGDA